MEEAPKIAPTDQPIYWNKQAPAAAAEAKAFWESLRHFYRTGEKPKSKEEPKLRSALSHLLNGGVNSYPFVLGSEEAQISLELNENTPFYLLDQLISANQKENRKSFKTQLSSLIDRINGLLGLSVETTEAEQLSQTYDFAGEMFAFEKMAQMMPSGSIGQVSKARMSRLKAVINIMQKGLDFFNGQNGLLIVNENFEKELRAKQLFKEARMITSEGDVFVQTQQLFRQEMGSFSELIKAYRIAELEVEGAYEEGVHDEYFEHFTWHRLLPEELSLFHSIVLIVNHGSVFDHLTSFSRLMASNQPIKVIVVNNELISKPTQHLGWEDASHQFRQELAALCIAHRNIYTLQSGLDDPSFLQAGLASLLKTTFPALCHLSVPKDGMLATGENSVLTYAGHAGRYFTRMIYDPGTVQKWGGRLDINSNCQPGKKWPLYTLTVRTSEKAEAKMDVAFTYADYKAMFPEKARELMTIPSAFYSEHLVPLADYLELSEAELYGKIPYVLALDENRQLQRAAVPNVWVVSCQERLDYWTFLQEIGGVNRPAEAAALAEPIAETTNGMEAMEAKLKEEYQEKLERIQQEAVAKAAERIIAALLNDEELSPK